MSSYRYYIYGLSVNSNKKIHLLSECENDRATNLDIVWGSEVERPYIDANWQRMMNDGLRNRLQLSVYTAVVDDSTVIHLQYHIDGGNTSYYINSDKKEVQIICDNIVPESDVQSMFLGPGLGAILRLRGTVCLHASVVNIDGFAVAFIGHKEAGKSTMAAAFVQKGYQVLSDDIAVIRKEDGVHCVASGYPKVRLRPKALTAIHNKEAEEFKQVYSSRVSRYTDVEDSFHDESLPLGAVYVLNKTTGIGDIPQFEEVKDALKYVRLCKNAFGSYVLTKELRMNEFMFLGGMAAKVPVRNIMLEHNIDKLDIHCQSIVDDFRQIISA